MSTTREGYAFVDARALLPPAPVCIDRQHLLRPPSLLPGERGSFSLLADFLIVARAFGLRRPMPLGWASICMVCPSDMAQGDAGAYVVVSDSGAPVLVAPLLEWQQRIGAFLDEHAAPETTP
jgi:hypothetical protein